MTTNLHGTRNTQHVPHGTRNTQHASPNIELSLLIPARNEASTLPRTVPPLSAYLIAQDIPHEIIIIENASTDDTWPVSLDLASQLPHIRPLRIPTGGKGAALRAGVLNASGRFLFTWDADSSLDIDFIGLYYNYAINRCYTKDFILIANRSHPFSYRINEPIHRYIMGRLYNTLTHMILPDLRSISDTQCGYKLFSQEAAKFLFRDIHQTGWAWDVEILYNAFLWNIPILSLPCIWTYHPSTRLHPLRDSLAMAAALLQIKKNARLFPGRAQHASA